MGIEVGRIEGVYLSSGGGSLPFWFFYDEDRGIDLVSGVSPSSPGGVLTWPLSSLPQAQIGLQGSGPEAAIGELQIFFVTNFDDGVSSGNLGLLSANGSDSDLIYLDATNNQITASDGTNTVSIPITASNGQSFRVRLLHGYIQELSGTKIALILDILDGSGGIISTNITSTSDFDGEFPISATNPDLEAGRGGTDLSINDIIWFKSPTALSILMFQGMGFQYELQSDIG